MDDIRKERLVLSITTLASLSCFLQNFFGGWEFWVPPLIVIGVVLMWTLHIMQRLNGPLRVMIYFVYSALLVFYHGIHETSLYDVSVAVMLFMAAFTIVDRTLVLNLILAEYVILMLIQLLYLHRGGDITMDAFTVMRIVFHIGTVACLYLFSRITVSRRNAENEKLREWRTAVSESDHDMEDFLSNISHELRTPVNVVNGMTTLLQKESDREELTAIRSAGIRLSHQIEDIQDYTELKRGELVLEEDNYMCISLINDVVAHYRMTEKKAGLELIIDLAPGTPAMLRGDIRKLHKIFRHLLDNSLKFTHRGGVYIKVFPEPQDYGINLTIEVTDTGIGMTRADMARLSRGMYQANKKRNRSTGGIGIGLPIVYGLVHKMGGFVRISSTKGKGTTVRLSIPQQVVDPSPCLSLEEGAAEDIVFYIRPEKYKVPEIRAFHQAMAVDLAAGLGRRLYSTGEQKELQRLLKEKRITHIFLGQEEYEAERDFFDQLAQKGEHIAVSVGEHYEGTVGPGIHAIPKPLYGFPVVRFVNGADASPDFDGEEGGRVSFPGIRALIVDDEPMNLVVAAGLLKDYEMIPDTAESGREAIEKYTSGDYEVVFMDHMMPEMDGVEAMKHIRQTAASSARHPVIIALTANALSGAREMFLREGFDGFIAKPIDIAEFERVMKRVLSEETVSGEGRDGS